MNKFKLQKKENIKGITLIALVVTIIVLLILAGITISTLFGENGIITKAQLAKMKYEEAEKKEKEMLDSIFKENEKEDTETYQIKINTEALSFNETLGTFTVVIEYLAEKNGIEYENDIVEIKISNIEKNTTNLEISAPKGSDLILSNVYCSPNYDLKSESRISKKLDNVEEIFEFDFTYEYNGKVITSM